MSVRMFGSYRELIWVGLVVFVAYSIYETGLAILRAKRKPITYSIATTINAGLRLPLAAAFFIWMKTGVSGMFWAMAIMYGLSHILVVMRHVGRPRLKMGPKARTLMVDVLYYGLPIWLTHVLNFLIVNSDLYFIKVLQGAAGDAQAGLYSAVATLIDQPMVLVFNTFAMAVFPSVAAAWESQGVKSTQELVRGVTRIFLLLCLPLMVFLSVLAHPIFVLLARGDTWQAYVAAPWIAAASFLFGLSYFAGFGLHLSKKTVPLMLATVLALAANAALNLLLIPRHGFVGAGMARLAANALLVAGIAIAGHRYFTWRFPFASLLKISIAAALTGGLLYHVQGLLPENLLTLTALFALGGLSYGLLLIPLGEIPLNLIREALAWIHLGKRPRDG